jgi:hypothetical protein
MIYFCEIHFACMDREDLLFRFDVGEREFDFPVDSAWSDESWVKTLNSIGCQYHLELRIIIVP